MAYMNQEKKAQIAAELKKVIPSNWKWSLKVDHHSSLTLTIASAPVDLIGKLENADRFSLDRGYVQLNTNRVSEWFADEEIGALMGKIQQALNCINHDRSDISTDYFDVGYYSHFHIGKWNKPFVVTSQQREAA